MKFALAAALLLLGVTDAYASCASIRNNDRRAACEAQSRSGSSSSCERIRNADRRAACRGGR